MIFYKRVITEDLGLCLNHLACNGHRIQSLSPNHFQDWSQYTVSTLNEAHQILNEQPIETD